MNKEQRQNIKDKEIQDRNRELAALIEEKNRIIKEKDSFLLVIEEKIEAAKIRKEAIENLKT